MARKAGEDGKVSRYFQHGLPTISNYLGMDGKLLINNSSNHVSKSSVVVTLIVFSPRHSEFVPSEGDKVRRKGGVEGLRGAFEPRNLQQLVRTRPRGSRRRAYFPPNLWNFKHLNITRW